MIIYSDKYYFMKSFNSGGRSRIKKAPCIKLDRGTFAIKKDPLKVMLGS